MPKETWGLFHKRALAAGMDDASACHAADEAMKKIEQEDKDDVWRETMNREPGQE